MSYQSDVKKSFLDNAIYLLLSKPQWLLKTVDAYPIEVLSEFYKFGCEPPMGPDKIIKMSQRGIDGVSH